MDKLLSFINRLCDAVLFFFIDYYRRKKEEAEQRAKRLEIQARIENENKKIAVSNLPDLIRKYNERRRTPNPGGVRQEGPDDNP